MRPVGSGSGGGSHPDIALLAQTDELLDRIGQRSPTLPDLDDPLLASLAVLAADVDLDEVPLQRTRRALGQHGLWPPRVDATRTLQPWGDDLALLAPPAEPAGSDRSVPSVTTDATGATGALDAVELPSQRGLERAGDIGSEAGADILPLSAWRPLVPRTRAEALAAEAAGIPERRSLVSKRDGRVVSLRVLPILGAAGAALVLSMGAAAALTSGQSVNPAKALSQVVERIAEGASPSSSGDASSDPGLQNASGNEAAAGGGASSIADPTAGSTDPAGVPSPSVSPSGSPSRVTGAGPASSPAAGGSVDTHSSAVTTAATGSGDNAPAVGEAPAGPAPTSSSARPAQYPAPPGQTRPGGPQEARGNGGDKGAPGHDPEKGPGKGPGKGPAGGPTSAPPEPSVAPAVAPDAGAGQSGSLDNPTG